MTYGAEDIKDKVINNLFTHYGFDESEWAKNFYKSDFWERSSSAGMNYVDGRKILVDTIHKDYLSHSKTKNPDINNAIQYIKEHEADISILNPEIWDKIKVILNIDTSIPASTQDVKENKEAKETFNIKYIISSVITGVVFFILSSIF